MNKLFSLLAMLMLFAAPVWAGDEMDTDKPSIYASQRMMATAVVEAIDHKTREVTLRKEDGSTVTFVARKEARNLGQVQVGDIVVAEYIESISIEVVAANGATPEVDAGVLAARTEEGEMPGVAVVEAVVITATVEEINIEANTFKLKGPQGNINEYTARNPENLKKAAVGDLVIITYTEAIALTVEKAK